MKHTEGPWIIGVGCRIRDLHDNSIALCAGEGSDFDWKTNEANARLIAAAPDRHQQLLAIIKYNWSIAKVSLYDEEGIEGWRWMEPDGQEHVEVGDWDDLPPWPDSARQAITKAESED